MVSLVPSIYRVEPQNLDVVWKTTTNGLLQDGYNVKLNQPESTDERSDQILLSLENGIRYQTYPFVDGQKTGVYSDQPENRRLMAQYYRDKRVL